MGNKLATLPGKAPRMDRRRFVKTAAAAGAAASVAPRFAIGQPGPSANSRLNIAMIGAVCVSTPDHTHFPATMKAMEQGKHVCTQKPLTHNIWEARTLVKAMAKYKVITNMAVQGHTCDGIRQMREWYEAGVFGQITPAHSWAPGPHWDSVHFGKPASIPPPSEPVPDGLEYDLWLGPAAETPYNSMYHPKKWRGFHNFGGGTLGDWFCHVADAPVWILDLYEPGFRRIGNHRGGQCMARARRGVRALGFPGAGGQEALHPALEQRPQTLHSPVPPQWTWGDLPVNGTLFFGEKNTGFTDERSNHPRLADKEAMKAFKEAGYPAEKYPRVKDGPFEEWVRAIKGTGPLPGASFDFAARLTKTSLLGCLVQRFGGRIEWDAANMRITNRPELNAYIREPARKGWSYGENLWKTPGFLDRLMGRLLGK